MTLLDRTAVRFLSSAAQADYNHRCYTPFIHALMMGCPAHLREAIPNYTWLLMDFDREAKSYPAPWTMSAIANLVRWVLKEFGALITLDMLDLAMEFSSYKVRCRGVEISVVNLDQAERITEMVEAILDATEPAT